jgi:hypothetical protein
MRRSFILAMGGVCLAAAAGCSNDDPCDPNANTGCEGGQVCEVVQDGEPACFDPVVVRGDVFDMGDESAVGGARVVALDVDRAAVSNVGTSNDDGRYEIRIPSTRDADGAPAAIELTLRADATGYQSFPGGVRQPIPIDTATAVQSDGAWVIDGTESDVGLFALDDASRTASITGHVELPAGVGAIVVAENASGTGVVGYDAVVDRNGDYAILNLPAGDFTVSAYAVGLVHDVADVTLDDGGTADVDLGLVDSDAVTLSGTVQFADAGGTANTSVVLFVESTFDANLMRGAAPPLLRVENVSGAFSIEGVPPGRYVVLAAFDNDALVRDPDTCIAGTDIVHVEVGGADLALEESFKITSALAMISPAAGEEVPGGVPTFTWEDDSSEDLYRVVVYDSFGIEQWSKEIPGVSGSNPTVTYDGATPLASGMFYQVRVTSVRTSGGTGGSQCEISQSEDLAGVFFVP